MCSLLSQGVSTECVLACASTALSSATGRLALVCVSVCVYMFVRVYLHAFFIHIHRYTYMYTCVCVCVCVCECIFTVYIHTGKTYTMEGEIESVEKRGLLPRMVCLYWVSFTPYWVSFTPYWVSFTPHGVLLTLLLGSGMPMSSRSLLAMD